MTLEELADTLPNGLHDAEITSFRADYSARRAVFDCSIWVGDMDEPERLEAYRDGELIIEGLQFLCVEAPDARYPFQEGSRLRIDLAEGRSKSIPAAKSVGQDCFVSSLFVDEWNSHIHLAGRGASLTWNGEIYIREGAGGRPRP